MLSTVGALNETTRLAQRPRSQWTKGLSGLRLPLSLPSLSALTVAGVWTLSAGPRGMVAEEVLGPCYNPLDYFSKHGGVYPHDV